jgi:hypothetical protein
MDNKQKYIKTIRQQIKDQQKWRQDAIDLLVTNGESDPSQHSSILRFNIKIDSLEKEIEDFTEESTDYQIFSDKLDLKFSKEKVQVVSTKPHEDRWADTKVQNAMKREWNWLCRMDGFVPQYMKDNLRKMPNNKGYIWKGIFYFGLLPPENPMELTTAFEKHNQALFIHEWSPNYYKIYEKSDKQKSKVLTFEKYF